MNQSLQLAGLLFLASCAGCASKRTFEAKVWGDYQAHAAPDYRQQGVETVAVFLENQTEQEVSPAIQATLEGYLISEKGYKVVNREHWSQILEEQALSVSDLTEAPERVGELLNVDALLVVKLGGWQKMDASMVSVATGQTLFVSQGSFGPVYFATQTVYWTYPTLEGLPLVLRDLPQSKFGRYWSGHNANDDGTITRVIFDVGALTPTGERYVRMYVPGTSFSADLWDWSAFPTTAAPSLTFKTSESGAVIRPETTGLGQLKLVSTDPITYEGEATLGGLTLPLFMQSP